MKLLVKKIVIAFKYGRQTIASSIDLTTRLAEGVVIGRKSKLYNAIVEHYSYIGDECRIFLTDIGAYTSIGPRVVIGENEHSLSSFSTSEYLYSEKVRRDVYEHNRCRTKVGNNVWVGCGVIIKKGVEIGDGAVIGAGSVVVKDVQPYTVVVGNPARKIKSRDLVRDACRNIDFQRTPSELK